MSEGSLLVSGYFFNKQELIIGSGLEILTIDRLKRFLTEKTKRLDIEWIWTSHSDCSNINLRTGYRTGNKLRSRRRFMDFEVDVLVGTCIAEYHKDFLPPVAIGKINEYDGRVTEKLVKDFRIAFPGMDCEEKDLTNFLLSESYPRYIRDKHIRIDYHIIGHQQKD